MTKTVLTGVLPLLFFLCSLSASSQINQGDWLIGGSASIAFESQSSPLVKINTTLIDVPLHAGYFLKDRLAVGLKPDFSLEHSKTSSDVTGKTHAFFAGPFLRYYVFPNNQRANFFVEGSYAWGVGFHTWGNNPAETAHLSRYAFLGGPVIFLNEAVALEFTIGYNMQHSDAVNKDWSSITQAGIGLQFHIAPINK